jgi:hypothetical protein
VQVSALCRDELGFSDTELRERCTDGLIGEMASRLRRMDYANEFFVHLDDGGRTSASAASPPRARTLRVQADELATDAKPAALVGWIAHHLARYRTLCADIHAPGDVLCTEDMASRATRAAARAPRESLWEIRTATSPTRLPRVLAL